MSRGRRRTTSMMIDGIGVERVGAASQGVRGRKPHDGGAEVMLEVGRLPEVERFDCGGSVCRDARMLQVRTDTGGESQLYRGEVPLADVAWVYDTRVLPAIASCSL